MSATANEPSSTRTPPFERILCLTGLTREGAEAVRQAAVLAGPGATIDLVTVAPRRPPGMPHPQAEQIESLVIGDRLASERAVESRPHIAEAADEPTGVLDSVAGHDLVVVPDGGTGLEVLSRAHGVRPDRPRAVGAHAVPRVHPRRRGRDGRGPRRRTARRGALRPPCRSRRRWSPRRSTTRPTSMRWSATSKSWSGSPASGRSCSTSTAARCRRSSPQQPSVEASLIVMGRRPGAHDRSVSAQVAGAATCSVLVVRGPPERSARQRPRAARLRRARTGDPAADVVPSPGCDTTENVPSISETRSRIPIRPNPSTLCVRIEADAVVADGDVDAVGLSRTRRPSPASPARA